MIFVGDIASPWPVEPDHEGFTFSGPVIANLEGALVDAGPEALAGSKVFNHPHVLRYLEHLDVRLVTLANNHILDAADSPRRTIDRLAAAGISSCGAGDSLNEAGSAILLEDGDRPIYFVGFGWKVIGCIPAGPSSPGVNPLDPHLVIETVRRLRREHADARIVLLMHWDYELEIYPLPMHRQLAFRAVEAGADAIIGCHSHCVQGIEVHHGAPIVYGLGNWFFLQNTFFGGTLSFPVYAQLRLAFEWTGSTDTARCHWVSYGPKSRESRQVVDFHHRHLT